MPHDAAALISADRTSGLWLARMSNALVLHWLLRLQVASVEGTCSTSRRVAGRQLIYVWRMFRSSSGGAFKRVAILGTRLRLLKFSRSFIICHFDLCWLWLWRSGSLEYNNGLVHFWKSSSLKCSRISWLRLSRCSQLLTVGTTATCVKVFLKGNSRWIILIRAQWNNLGLHVRGFIFWNKHLIKPIFKSWFCLNEPIGVVIHRLMRDHISTIDGARLPRLDLPLLSTLPQNWCAVTNSWRRTIPTSCVRSLSLTT